MAFGDARRNAAPLISALIPVPPAGAGVCGICHSGVDPDYQYCYPCRQARRLLGDDLPAIVPVSLEVEGQQLHHVLRNYKDGRDPAVRVRFSYQLAGLSGIFWHQHEGCLGTFDAVTTVPSARRDAFQAVVGRSERLSELYRPLVTATGVGGTRDLDAQRFDVASREVRGRRIILIDDTFTTGATVFSAASAIQAAGGIVTHVVVVGRYIKSTYGPSARILDRTRSTAWAESECVCCRVRTSLF